VLWILDLHLSGAWGARSMRSIAHRIAGLWYLINTKRAYARSTE